ncbi:MAG: EAL domain-containing protein [Janthinobacterium lividum]
MMISHTSHQAAQKRGPTVARTPAWRLLLIDHDARALARLQRLLGGRGYELVAADGGVQALAKLESAEFDLIVISVGQANNDGMDFLPALTHAKTDSDLLLLLNDTDFKTAVDMVTQGEANYLGMPYSRRDLQETVDNVLRQRWLKLENLRMRTELDRSESRYRYLVDSSPDIIYTLDEKGQFSFVNDRVHQLLGLEQSGLIGNHYQSLVHQDDLERAYYVFNERRVGDRASRNVELRVRSGSLRDPEHGGNAGLPGANNPGMRTMSFNSVGMYCTKAGTSELEFFGTYGVARDITERKRAEEMISYQAYHDVLTDLPNRALFKDRLGLGIIQARRRETELAVMFIDLDRFKLVNDTLGHVKGDELLKQVSARLKSCLRQGDTLARLGGDEFTIFLPDLRNRDDAQVVANKFLDSLRLSFALDGQEVHISASIGIAIYPRDGDSIDELLVHADIAMYQIKGQGKNGFCFYDPAMLEVSYQKITLAQSLHRAIEQGEFEMYYQPQIDVRSGAIIGAEGLMRWNHPQRGLLSAGEFLPFAEENGLMLPITDWMLGALCSDLQQWNKVGGKPKRMSLNLSPQYLERGDFVTKMQAALHMFDILPTQIEVEITENICIGNPQHAVEQLNKLCRMGVSVAIDDFGTGYSSLAYLHRFPIHTIKIDQSFVREIHEQHGHYPVITAIISIAKGLGLNLVAEGVETMVQAGYLQQSGCHTMQGYLYHRAMTSTQFIDLLKENGSAPKLLGYATASRCA